jgi:hypothetical protein
VPQEKLLISAKIIQITTDKQSRKLPKKIPVWSIYREPSKYVESSSSPWPYPDGGPWTTPSPTRVEARGAALGLDGHIYQWVGEPQLLGKNVELVTIPLHVFEDLTPSDRDTGPNPEYWREQLGSLVARELLTLNTGQ